MWPIVPTFTCGLLRSNFSFAITFCLNSNDKFLQTFLAYPDQRLPTASDKTRASGLGPPPTTLRTTPGRTDPIYLKLHLPARALSFRAPHRNCERAVPCFPVFARIDPQAARKKLAGLRSGAVQTAPSFR